MAKRILSLVPALLLALCLTGCSRDKAAARTPDIDFYIQFASEKFGVPEEEISVVEFEKASTAVTTRTVWITPLQKYTIPPTVRLEWGGKTVTFAYSHYGDFYDTSCLHNDYYYDELYEGLQEYYLDRLHVKDVIPVCELSNRGVVGEYNSEGIRCYLERHEVTGVDASVVEDLIHSEDDNSYWDGRRMRLLVALEGTDPEEEIKQLIDDIIQLDHEIAHIDVWSSLDGISVSREPEKDRRALLLIDHQLISGIDYSTRWTTIDPINEGVTYSEPYKVYRGCFYDTTNLPESNTQEADASMDESNNID